MIKLIGVTAGAAISAVVTLTAGAGLLTGTLTDTCQTTATSTPSPSPGHATPPGIAWTAEQRHNADVIVTVGTSLAVPPRGQVIALATAIQESSLHNLPGGDRDSLGLFQQRPSQGWGTPAQILDPVYAATRFYQALLAVPNWQAMQLSEAAQAVQRSAHPAAYADDEPAATTLYTALTGSSLTAPLAASGCTFGLPWTTAPSDITVPSGANPQAAVAIGWAVMQVGTPYQYGGDCTAAHSGNPARRCDCSSLTQQAFAAAGITLPRTAAEQSRTGLPVPPEQLRPGDLIFSAGALGTVANPGHVALYLGDSLVVEAPHTGADVRVAPLDAARLAAVVTIRRVVGWPD